jgi:3-oxoacyl-[acyl-carrier protein] reductase
LLAQAGAALVVVDLVEPQETVRAIEGAGHAALGLTCDVTSRTSVRSAVDQARAWRGRLDIVVNNAGVVERSSLEDLQERTIDQELDVILKGTIFVTQAAYPALKAQGGGKIVNISSISGKLGGAASRAEGAPSGRSGPAYAAAKGGVIAFTKWVAKDAGRYGIHVNAVCPGPVATAMTRGYDYGVDSQPIPRMGEPADIAAATLFFASQMSNFVTGQTLNVDGGVLME